MNNNLPVLAWLMGVFLGISALLNGFFVFQQYVLTGDLQRMDARLARASELERAVRSLSDDLIRYSQKQPAIFPILQKYGLPTPPPPQPEKPEPAKAPAKKKS